MKIALDIETDSLHNPTNIWCVVCKDLDTGVYEVFKDIKKDDNERERFSRYMQRLRDETDSVCIGHNILGFDWPILCSAVQLCNEILPVKFIDTLVISKMVDFSRKKHSLEDYGVEFGLSKIDHKDFSKLDDRLIEYCKRDVDITTLVYTKYTKYIEDSKHKEAINLENNFVYYVVNTLGKNGFSFNLSKAKDILKVVEEDILKLDKDILRSFPKKLKPIREILPRITKYGTISLSNIPRDMRGRVSELTAGVPFTYCKWVEFNPSSHKQIVDVLNEAGWSPINKTDTHVETERELSRVRYGRHTPEELESIKTKLKKMEVYGWKVDEENLDTLPPTAPASTRTLARRILLESRRRTLVEWIELVQPDGRIHGEFQGIGAWSHRMSHRHPNTANIPNELDTNGKKKLLGKEFRQLWRAPKNRLLVGVDAEGIQLRIFAHYIDDKEFTQSLEQGKKEDKSDPHSLNQRILGSVCRTRQQAKRFVYALLLGGGIGKLSAILGCQQVEAEAALERLLDRYTGFAYLKREVIPKDARRGWFTGLDGRSVAIPADTVGGRKHLAMSGYLQNGEKVVMARATLEWIHRLGDYGALLVDLVHDEWQIECPNDVKVATEIAEMVSGSLPKVGRDLKLKCKLAGSYWNDDHKDYTIGANWYQTH